MITTILPITDMRKYNDVFDEVDANGVVYITRHGRGAYRIEPINANERQVANKRDFLSDTDIADYLDALDAEFANPGRKVLDFEQSITNAKKAIKHAPKNL